MSDEAPKCHKVFKTLTFDLKSSSFTSPNASTTTPTTINLPTIAGKSLPRALQPKANQHGVSAGYKPLFVGSVLKQSEGIETRRSSMISTATFKSQCSPGKPSTAKDSSEHSTPLKHRHSVQVECPASNREVQGSKPSPSPTTIHISKRSGVDNESIFLSLGDVFGKRDPVEEIRRSEEVVLRNIGRHSRGEGRPDPPNSTVSKAFISLQGSNKQKLNSSVDASNLDLSWSSSYGQQKISNDGVVLARPSEDFPGTIRLFLNSEDKQNESKRNSNGSKEIDPSPIQVLTTKRNQVTITPLKDYKTSQQGKTSTCLETFLDTPRGVMRSSTGKNLSTVISAEVNVTNDVKADVTNAGREVLAVTGEEFQSSASHPGSAEIQFKESDHRDEISPNDDEDNDNGRDDDDDDDDVEDSVATERHHADDVTHGDGVKREKKFEPCHEEKVVTKENDVITTQEDGDDHVDDDDDGDDDDAHKNVINDDDDDDVHKNEIDDGNKAGDVVGKDNDEIISPEGVNDKDFDNDDDDDDEEEGVGHDSHFVSKDVKIPASFPSFFVENSGTTQAERSTYSSEEIPAGNQSTVKSTETHAFLREKNFREDSTLLTTNERNESDESCCLESTNPLFIDDSRDQEENTNNYNKQSATTTTTTTIKHDKQLRRKFDLIDNSLECSPSKIEEGIQDSFPRDSAPRSSSSAGLQDSEVKGEEHRLNFDTTTVRLEKGFLGVGFCIEGGKASPYGDKPILIKRVVRGDVPLRAGDELVSVNGEQVASMTSAQVWSLLKSLPYGVMVLELRRKE